MDMIGVLVLGYDVFSLQNFVRNSAEENMKYLKSHFGNFSGLDSHSNWKTGSESEGLFEWDGGVDVEAAQRDFERMRDRVIDIADSNHSIISFLEESAEAQVASSQKSIRWTIVGMVLIFVGFGLQIAATLLGA